ncbi:MAG: SMC-Scp complex subunit ScpB [Bacillota bacterium]
MRLKEMEAVIESLLFISGEAVPLSVIAKTIELDKATTRAMVVDLISKYEKEKRGLRISQVEDGYQMSTAPKCFEYIRSMYQSPVKTGLSQSLLETLAIIAYKQPITKMQIEEIRGVSASHAVMKLMERNLIYEVGRSEVPGRPILLGTTQEFLRHFGFTTMEELPPLKEVKVEELKDFDGFEDLEEFQKFKQGENVTIFDLEEVEAVEAVEEVEEVEIEVEIVEVDEEEVVVEEEENE